MSGVSSRPSEQDFEIGGRGNLGMPGINGFAAKKK